MGKEWKKTKTIYWSDELNDDFDEVGLTRPPVPEGYKYKRKNVSYNFFGAILYHIIAKPILAIYCLFKGIKVKNKKNLKVLKGQGAYIYSNHTAITDVFKFQSYVFFFGRRVNILGYSDTLSMPIVKSIARMLGYLPVPLKGDMKNLLSLSDACNFYINKKQFVLIYPEAHIWPYYTKVRNFLSNSFTYPARYMSPVVPVITIWRKPRIGRKPKQTIVFGTPIFPKQEFNANQNKDYLYNECLKQMKDIASSYPQFEYIKYIKKDKNND